ncbi:MAG: OmpA family protein [Balneolaceae bacterium]|nr:OmpA family protein [Balneolaceae bacterium]MBO6544934.1 OmpA family protein [Balneolaceae bacterium]MBO6646330.1 OmpA family protein [Balneolaceae bacterium]
MYTLLKKGILLMAFLGIPFLLYAQDADDLFESGKYQSAANAYERLAVSDPEYFKNAAESYTALQDWDKAIENYRLYINRYSGADKAKVEKIIELLEAPDEEIYIDNLGANVNSDLDEFLPRISSDGSRMYFYSTDRSNGFGGGDVWYSSKQSNGNWSEPNNMGSIINTDSHEGILSLSSDGNTAIVFGNYEGRFGNGDFFYSAKIGDSWTVPCNLGGDVNSSNWESMANLSPDGKTLIFVAYHGRKNAEDADYETDIYITHLRNGRWTEPKPISTTINTTSSETWPFLNADGRTLYFSSDGHPGLGGSDLFVTRRIGEGWDNWTTPVNLGKNINSVLDDEDMTIPASGTVAYFTRETTGEGDGFGDDDIFRMILPPDMRPDPVVTIYGNVTNQEDSLIAATLYWSDFDTGEQLGYSTSNPRTGDYLINLPFGRRYLITANQRGYLFQTEMLDLKTMVDDSIAFSEKLGSELFRMRNALSRIDQNRVEYERLLASTSTNLDQEFDELSDLSKEMNQAQADLNASIRRARISWLEDNSGYEEVRKDISLTEANEGARIVLENIYFDTGSDNLREESIQELDRLYEIMAQSNLIIEIGGHTDNVGSDETNMDLSQARAEAVVNYVIEKGISSTRISAQGYGETDPRATNETAEGRQENRRVEVKVLGSVAQEGTGGVLEQQRLEEEALSSENLYELYRQAAMAGGIPEGAACYDTSNYSERSTTYVSTNTNNNRTSTSTARSTSPAWFIDANGNDISAFGGSSINFLSHTGNGQHGFANVGGAGVLFQSSKGTGERNFYGYFIGNAVGGGIDWIRYKDLTRLTKLPLSLDYGLSAYLVFNKEERSTFGGENYDFFTTSWGIPLKVRLRYNLEVSDIKVSPYASYNYNLLSFVEPEPESISEGNEVYPQAVVDAPHWLEFGARAKFKFLSAGLGIQNGGAGSGIMFRAGLAF